MHQTKGLVLILVNQIQIFCPSFYYNHHNSYLFVNENENYQFEAYNRIVNFCPVRRITLKRNVYDFSVNYDAIDKSNMLNIHKYLMVKNNLN